MTFSGGPDHASHVAGILGAAANNSGVRGVNPGAQIVSVRVGSTFPDIAAAFDWVLADAEQSGIYAVANFSQNGGLYWEGNPGGTLNSYLRRVSNRVLVVQSAGNQRQDSCNEAYGGSPPGGGSLRTNSSDGILVVGGIDENGQAAAPYDNTVAWGPGNTLPGTDYGPCVEVWAPSQRIWSTWNTALNATQILSGTSMAAPHVTALAARYGSGSTTPVEREQWIRAKVFYTGYTDFGTYITVPSYTQPPSTGLSGRIFPVATSADATLSGTSTSYLSDGLYLSGTWNSGHFAPAWVQFDFGASKVITSIRMTPEQYPAGSVTHYVYAGNTPFPSSLIATLSGPSNNLEPMAAAIGTYARYVLVYTTASPSWVAFREIELYGY